MTLKEAISTGREALERGDVALAEALARQLLREHRNEPRAIDLLGQVALRLGRNGDAAQIYTLGIAVAPNAGTMHNNLALALHNLAQFDRAEQHYRRALELGLDRAEVHFGLAIVLEKQGKLAEAQSAFRRVLELDPRMERAAVALAAILRSLGRVQEANQVLRDLLSVQPLATAAHSMLLFNLNLTPDVSPRDVFAEHVAFGELHERPFGNQPPPGRAAQGLPQARAKLRIGFVSADFRAHAIAHFLQPLLRGLDRNRFEVFCYSAVASGDELTPLFRQWTDHWIDIHQQSDDSTAERIRADGIDVLIDLGGHTDNSRLLIFARKPAPLQITWLGYLGTTGLRGMDFRVTDPHLENPGSAKLFTEAPLMLPRTYWCYAPPEDAPSIEDAPHHSDRAITFGSLNNFVKYSPRVLATWAQRLAQAPESRLILHSVYPEAHDVALQPFLAAGIARKRVEFVGRQPLAQYLQTYSRIDVALDPFPYGGGATTCEALWMGTPVVTLAGHAPFSRTGVSILSNLGLSELITTSSDAYIEAAIAASARSNEYRRTMRERMLQSPLTDAAGFVRDFEQAIVRAFS